MDIGRILIAVGILLVIVGLLWTLGSRIPWIGRLPGDIYLRKGNFQMYFPVMTSILVSIILTLVLWLLRKQ